MPFFGPPPSMPPAGHYEPPPWGPPLWDRPAEDTLGVTVALTLLLATSEQGALVFDEVRAYPNGFTFGLVTIHNPNLPVDLSRPRLPFRHMARVGFEFADGAVVSSEQLSFPPTPGPAFNASSQSVILTADSSTSAGGPELASGPEFDDDGVPVGHVLRALREAAGTSTGRRWGSGASGSPLPGP